MLLPTDLHMYILELLSRGAVGKLCIATKPASSICHYNSNSLKMISSHLNTIKRATPNLVYLEGPSLLLDLVNCLLIHLHHLQVLLLDTLLLSTSVQERKEDQ